VAPQELSREWLELINRPQERLSLGNRAQQLFLQHTGATARSLEALRPLLGAAQEVAHD